MIHNDSNERTFPGDIATKGGMMKNLIKYNSRIAIGDVPRGAKIVKLAAMGYHTLVDLRNEEEKRCRDVWWRARELGMSYIDIPIYRENIELEDVFQFLFAVHEMGNPPFYAFSKKGRRPLAFLILYDAVLNDRPIDSVFAKASQLGIQLEDDALLMDFLVEFNDRWRMKEVVTIIQTLSCDLSMSSPPQEHL